MAQLAGAALLFCAALLAGGCQSTVRLPTTQPSAGLASSRYVPAVDAVCTPPAGWTAEPLKSSSRHAHEIWISPSGATAYGVVRMSLPLPAGPESLLQYGVLPNMKAVEGKADLLAREDDPSLPGVRFVAESNQHLVRGYVLTHWFKGWMIYAGTKAGKPVNQSELELAIRAREHTLAGQPHEPLADASAPK